MSSALSTTPTTAHADQLFGCDIGSFKALGAPYAMYRILAKEVYAKTESCSRQHGYHAGSKHGSSLREKLGFNSSSQVVLFRLEGATDPHIYESLGCLRGTGWLPPTVGRRFPFVEDARAIIVLDDFSSPVLAEVSDGEWENIQALVLKSPSTLWVTQGAQFQVTNPNNALVNGLSRSIRAESPAVRLITLDVEAQAPQRNSPWRRLGDCRAWWYLACEQDFKELSLDHATAPRKNTQSMHDIGRHVQLGVRHVGTLNSLQLCEVPGEDPLLLPDQVEIEVHATGLDFKDVAVSTGLVPGDDHALGFEAAGIVTRVGPNVHGFQTGDKIVFMDRGAFTNRARISYKRVHHVAAALPVVFVTAILALVNIAGLSKGQSVLIHSGAGGVGIAAIQLSQYLGAEIYVTAGSEEKRHFLQERFNIRPSHVFSSRTTDFARGLLARTEGRGVDVILYSATGEFLDETRRTCADGGIMVDIGRGLCKRRLPSAPFERNCSVKAFDLIHSQISDDLVQSLLAHAFGLFQEQQIQVIHPMRIFAYADIRDAFHHLSTGRHVGKIVVANRPVDQGSSLSVRPAPPAPVVRSDRAYLITGGLHGVCGTLALYLALRGARSIVVLSRSGCSTSRAEGVVGACRELGCAVTVVEGDVTSYQSVKDPFLQSPLPVCGLIHGSMVLLDTPYELMNANTSRNCIAPKVQGAWNLHQAAADLSLELDLFTPLSSISGVIGQRGQANKPLSAYGMDSLSAGKLRNWVERSFQVTFAVFEILGATGLQSLCLKLITRMQGLPPN
ncbi:KR domain-containing protein [Aspergillus californicus]